MDAKDQAGKIISAGKTGATVRDDDGKTHQVNWARVTGHQKPKQEAAPEKKKHTSRACRKKRRGEVSGMAGGMVVWPLTGVNSKVRLVIA